MHRARPANSRNRSRSVSFANARIPPIALADMLAAPGFPGIRASWMTCVCVRACVSTRKERKKEHVWRARPIIADYPSGRESSIFTSHFYERNYNKLVLSSFMYFLRCSNLSFSFFLFFFLSFFCNGRVERMIIKESLSQISRLIEKPCPREARTRGG